MKGKPEKFRREQDQIHDLSDSSAVLTKIENFQVGLTA